MSFKIVVFVKQVPDTSDIRWTEHNTIQREGLDSIINPYDVGAIRTALNIKFLIPDTEIIVATMGPQQAKSMIQEALAMGCDEGYLLSDKKFAGSDTLATAYVLSQFIKTTVPDFKLIICGQQAIDGDTAQTPSSLAEKLKIPQICNVVSLKSVTEDNSVWIKDATTCRQEIRIQNPALISISLKDVDIIPKIEGYIKAQNADISVLTADDIMADACNIGFAGSPTQVKKAYRPVSKRKTELINSESDENIVDFLLNEINKCKVNND